MIFALIAAVFIFAEWRADPYMARRSRLTLLGIAGFNIACGLAAHSQGGL